MPRISGLRFQAVHSSDVGEAYRQAVVRDVRGAFNIAAEPVIGPEELSEALGARPVDVSPRVARALMDWSWKLRLQPSPPGWLDMALQAPLLDRGRAAAELGWKPAVGAIDALLELIEGVRRSEGMRTPPLDPETGGPARLGELRSGVGSRR